MQQMRASGAKVRPGSKGWTRAIAQRQVPIQEAVDCLFIELIDGEVALTHPPPEVRDAGNIVLGGLGRISAFNQVIEITRNVRCERTIAQPALGDRGKVNH